MSEPQLTVIIPNYKTPELTKICLRLLRKYSTAGKNMLLKLFSAGFDMHFLPSDDPGKLICHLNHDSMILTPAASDRKTGKPSARAKLSRKMQIFMDVLDSQDLDL